MKNLKTTNSSMVITFFLKNHNDIFYDVTYL